MPVLTREFVLMADLQQVFQSCQIKTAQNHFYFSVSLNMFKKRITLCVIYVEVLAMKKISKTIQ